MAETKIREFILHDIAHFGMRMVIGGIFITHSLGKFEPGFLGFLENIGLPPEMHTTV